MSSSATSQASKSNGRKKFSAEEDVRLRSLAQMFCCRNWDLIASFMPGRTGRQCRDRYRNYLVPGYTSFEWSDEEDQILRKKQAEMGKQWSKIAAFLPGRSPNAIKNRWCYFVSHNTTEYIPGIESPKTDLLSDTINSKFNVDTYQMDKDVNESVTFYDLDWTDSFTDIFTETFDFTA